MSENDMAEQIRRLTEAMNPLQRLVEDMAEASRSWMAAVTASTAPSAEHGEGVRGAADRMVKLSSAWIDPVRKLSEEHARFAEEMATWAKRHREFAEQVSEWAEAHQAVAEQLNAWSQPVLRYAELLGDTLNTVVRSMTPAEPGEDQRSSGSS